MLSFLMSLCACRDWDFLDVAITIRTATATTTKWTPSCSDSFCFDRYSCFSCCPGLVLQLLWMRVSFYCCYRSWTLQYRTPAPRLRSGPRDILRFGYHGVWDSWLLKETRSCQGSTTCRQFLETPASFARACSLSVICSVQALSTWSRPQGILKHLIFHQR